MFSEITRLSFDVTSWVKNISYVIKYHPLCIILRHAFYLRVDHDSSTDSVKPEPEGNQELNYSGYLGYPESSAAELVNPEVAQDQGKPRMHLTIP